MTSEGRGRRPRQSPRRRGAYRTAINLPFGRGAVVAGAPIYVQRHADDPTLELARRAVEEALNAATSRVYEMVDGTVEGAARD